MIKAVIFDFDGTLMNTLPGIAYHGNKALASLGLTPLDTDKYKYFVGHGRDVLVHRFLSYYNADTPENFKAAVKAYDQSYENDTLHDSHVYDGIVQVLEKLKSDGIKLGVLSNKPHNVTCDIVGKIFENTFDICYGQRPGIPKKPAPDSAFEIARTLGVDVSECAFVGDTDVDILTGNNAGMFSIGVLWGFREEAELAAAKAIAKVPEDIHIIVRNLK